VEKNIRFHHLGAIEGMPKGIQQDLRELEAATAAHTGLFFHLALNYGSRLELVHAVRQCLEEGLDPDTITEATIQARLWTGTAPDVDLLIRTSGEMRLSNFMLWQSAYAEFYVTETLWPDFGPGQLREALEVYQQRERRFGGLAAAEK